MGKEIDLEDITINETQLISSTGPQTFRSKDAPRYVPAEVVIVVCYAISMLDLGLIYWICRRQNTKKALFRAQSAYQKKENQEWLDLTDRENPEFIYEL